MGKELKKRDQIDQKYKWNIEDMFPDESLVEAKMAKIMELTEKFKEYEGHVTESAETLAQALKDNDEIWQKAEKIYVYARMRRDEDNSRSQYQAMTDKCNYIMAQVSAAESFFVPELLSEDN